MVVDDAQLDLVSEVLQTIDDRHPESALLPLLDAIDELTDWLTDVRVFEHSAIRSQFDES